MEKVKQWNRRKRSHRRIVIIEISNKEKEWKRRYYNAEKEQSDVSLAEKDEKEMEREKV